MEQKEYRHLLSDLWESYPDALSKLALPKKSYSIVEHLTDILSVGPYYYYVVNIADYSLDQVSDNTKQVHGFLSQPKTLKTIIDQIHPDDLDFVLRAEEACINKIAEIGFQHQLYLKSSYCFRMQIANGCYHMFHHQAIHLEKDNDGRLQTALNIHTDIHHIIQTNNKIVLVSGFGPRNDFYQMDLSISPSKNCIPKLSRREMEILPLIAGGNSSPQIAEQLFISPETVRTHRKNLFRKTNTKNVGEFIRKCIEWGLLQFLYFYTVEF